MSDETTQEITIKILGEAESFKKSVKESTRLAEDLNKLTSQYRKGGMSQTKTLEAVTAKHNKSQQGAGKDAYKLEQKLQKAIKANIVEIKKRQKAFGGSALAVKEEVKALKQLETQHRKVASFRKTTGYRSAGERFGGAAKSVGRGASGIAKGAGQGLMAVGGLVAGAVFAIAGTLVNAITSQITSGYASFINFGRARAGLSGMGAIKGGFGRSARLGFSKTETVQQMRGVGRATGNINAVGQAQAAARSFGGEVSEVTGLMGTMTRGGQGFGGRAGTGGEKSLTRIMSHAFTAGLDHSRAGEHLEAVAQGIKAAQTVSGGAVDSSQISAMLAFFGRSGSVGLQGAAGYEQISKVDQFMKSAGFGQGGDAASALAYQAMGFGQPGAGGRTSYYQATKQLQGGVFGEGGAGNLMKVFERFAQTGGGANTEKTNIEISNAMGMSLDVIEKIWGAIGQGGGTDATTKAIAAITKESMPIDKQILEATKGGHLAVAQRVAHLENRLIEIGERNHVAIEKLQDTFNDIVDTMMPTAVKILQTIAETIANLWSWLKDFFGGQNKTDAVKKDLDRINQQRDVIVNKIKTGEYTGEQGRTKLLALAASSNRGENTLSRDINPLVTAAETFSDINARVGGIFGIGDGQGEGDRRRIQAARAARIRGDLSSMAQASKSGWIGDAVDYEAQRAQLATPPPGESEEDRRRRQNDIEELRALRDYAQEEAIRTRQAASHPVAPLHNNPVGGRTQPSPSPTATPPDGSSNH